MFLGAGQFINLYLLKPFIKIEFFKVQFYKKWERNSQDNIEGP